VWLITTCTVKLLPHLWFRPQDIVYVPAFIAFGYYSAIIKLYALLTLHEVGWGTRAGIGAPGPVGKAVEQDGVATKKKLDINLEMYSRYDAECNTCPNQKNNDATILCRRNIVRWLANKVA